jgi:cellulose synthase/poly-beta-1,6-N-acetylglucosamine synthase-like glycosyltransferase
MTALLLCLLVLPVLLPGFALLLLTTAALLPAPRNDWLPVAMPALAPRVVVLVPAHNESAHLLPTVGSLRAQIGPGSRVLVVADNCTDDTAALARQAGADVVERHDPLRRGKGHALAFGVDQLRADPPDVVVVIDADCVPDVGAVADLAERCHTLQRPVQLLNLMSSPPGAALRIRVMEFAMVMKNLVRPLGSQRLGGVCHLAGTGMALPWALASTAHLATGHVAEDMALGVDLARAGKGAVFLPTARIRSSFLPHPAAVRVQKARWEHGHLDTLRTQLPGLLRDMTHQRSRPLAALALDLCIPPVALYVSMVAGLLAALMALAWAWPAARAAAALVAGGAGALVLAVLLGWWHFGRHLLRAGDLLRLPLYALWKLPVYLAYATGRRSGWVRTERATSTHLSGVRAP